MGSMCVVFYVVFIAAKASFDGGQALIVTFDVEQARPDRQKRLWLRCAIGACVRLQTLITFLGRFDPYKGGA